MLQECGIVYVTFLDDFSMTYNGKILDVSGIKSDKITELLAYIISHRYNNISVGSYQMRCGVMRRVTILPMH